MATVPLGVSLPYYIGGLVDGRAEIFPETFRERFPHPPRAVFALAPSSFPRPAPVSSFKARTVRWACRHGGRCRPPAAGRERCHHCGHNKHVTPDGWVKAPRRVAGLQRCHYLYPPAWRCICPGTCLLLLIFNVQGNPQQICQAVLSTCLMSALLLRLLDA